VTALGKSSLFGAGFSHSPLALCLLVPVEDQFARGKRLLVTTSTTTKQWHITQKNDDTEPPNFFFFFFFV
jgi:hypothetical protein